MLKVKAKLKVSTVTDHSVKMKNAQVLQIRDEMLTSNLGHLTCFKLEVFDHHKDNPFQNLLIQELKFLCCAGLYVKVMSCRLWLL